MRSKWRGGISDWLEANGLSSEEVSQLSNRVEGSNGGKLGGRPLGSLSRMG